MRRPDRTAGASRAARSTHGRRHVTRTPPTRTSRASSSSVESVGGEAFVSKGVVRTIIGLVGDIDSFHDLNLRSHGRASPTCTGSPTPTSWSAASTTATAPRSGWPAGVPIGPDTFTFIAGPCAVESPGRPLEAAEMAKAAGATLLRGGAFKPRTSPYAFQGLGVAGLEILADVREATGLPIVTEVVDARDVAVVAEHADMLQVGTRNMAELRAAPGGRRGRQAGAAQARHDRDRSRSG